MPGLETGKMGKRIAQPGNHNFWISFNFGTLFIHHDFT